MLSKIFSRSLLVFLWVCLILSVLYLPRWYHNSSRSRTINVFAWGDLIDPAVITTFQEKTGIKVNLNYYSSDEELLVKLKATQGEGYDLIAPSDYAVFHLIEEGLLQPLTHDKLPFLTTLSPYLLHHFFDPDNTYSIPFAWEIFGLGVDRDLIDPYTPPSWKMLFTDRGYKVSMINDPIAAVEMAAFYLFGAKEHLASTDISAVTDLLIAQKKWVEAYADGRGDYFLATKNCAVAVA